MDRRRRNIIALAGIALTLSACSSAPAAVRSSGPAPSSRVVTSASPHVTPTRTASRSAPPSRTLPTRTAAPSRTATPSRTAIPTRTVPPSPPAPRRVTTVARPLPLALPTGGAGQIITVTAPYSSSTTGTLQAWQRSGSGWRRIGPAVLAHLGADGVGRASESTSRTPAGSFTLTRAFGRNADPGSALPYRQTTPADWWISESGPLYNTEQHCTSSDCGFTRGDPNEHLYYETPYYDYAVVIDYNTTNAPGGVQAGAGSAFFLHVTVGAPTAGCVSIPQDDVVRILRWLSPAAHPRILIGVG